MLRGRGLLKLEAQVLSDLRWPSQKAEFPPAFLRFAKESVDG